MMNNFMKIIITTVAYNGITSILIVSQDLIFEIIMKIIILL